MSTSILFIHHLKTSSNPIPTCAHEPGNISLIKQTIERFCDEQKADMPKVLSHYWDIDRGYSPEIEIHFSDKSMIIISKDKMTAHIAPQIKAVA